LKSNKIITFAVALFVVFVLCASNAWAHDFINSTQGYDAGVWFTSFYGNVNYTNSLSLRGDLNLKNAVAFAADGEWRFNDKWGLGISYFHVTEEGDQTINRNTVFNNHPINRGDRLHAKLTLSTVSFLLRYNITRTEDTTFNVAAGARFFDFDLDIRKDPSLVPGFSFNLKPSATLLPAIGLSGKQRMTERLYIYGDFSGIFDVGGGDIKNANMYDFKAGLRWNFSEPGWYATAEYRCFGTRVSRSNGNSANIYFNGPAVTIRYEF